MDPGTPLTPTTLLHVCRLADGGMGRVDLAMRKTGSFRRLYAVKRLHLHLASNPDFRTMFLDEARIAGLLRHPNVAGVIDVGEDENGPFLVMDYVDGVPLANLVRLSRVLGERMPVQVAVRLALDVARGLHAAHELSVDGRPLGLVHRDLSPQNVLVGFDGSARIVDFGIAKALGRATRTATGVVKGKLGYMAPEQLTLEEPDRRSDLYSLGVLVYELLSGEKLHEVEKSGAVRRALDEAPPDIGEVRADVPDELVRLLFELLSARPDARPSDARDVAARLESILADLVAGEGPTEVGEYVALVASDVKAEQARVVDEAIARAEREEEERLASMARRRSRRRVALIGASVAMVLGVGAAIAVATLSRNGLSELVSGEDPEAAPSPPETEPPAGRPPSEGTAGARPAGETEPIEAAVAGEAPPAGGQPVVADEPRSGERRRARRARRAHAMAESMASAMSLPDWVEF